MDYQTGEYIIRLYKDYLQVINRNSNRSLELIRFTKTNTLHSFLMAQEWRDYREIVVQLPWDIQKQLMSRLEKGCMRWTLLKTRISKEVIHRMKGENNNVK